MELSNFILMRMYFRHHWLVPLGRTVFKRSIVKALSGKEIKLYKKKDKVDGLERIIGRCSVLNMNGMGITILKENEIIFKVCVHEDFSLPLYMYIKDSWGNTFEIEAVYASVVK